MALPSLKIPATPETEEPRTGLYCDLCVEISHSPFTPYAHKTPEGIWHWPASGGGFYEILPQPNDNWACACAGYQFRGRCQHLFGKQEGEYYRPGVYSLEAQGLIDNLAHATRVRYQQMRLEIY